jgi:DNA (cytosine-5)-methyltransferase 1
MELPMSETQSKKRKAGAGKTSVSRVGKPDAAHSALFVEEEVSGEPERIKVASFFAGIGGFDLGFENAGMETVWQCEKKPFCLDILEQHWPLIPRVEDIQEVDASDIPTAAIWAGGFPCQDVSLARMGPRSGLRGKQSGLFYDFAGLIGERRPPVVILENVAALLSSHEGRDFALVVRTLAELGYGVAWRVLDSRYFGVPQSRSRVFIVGSLGGPASAGSVLFESECGDRDLEKSRQDGPKPVSPFQISVGDSQRGIVKKLAHCLYAESARHTGTDWSRNYVSYPEGRVRRLTPLETERLQGFPDDWTMPKQAIDNLDMLDSARYHACGNAVSVPVAEWLGHRIVDQIGPWLLEQQRQLSTTDKSS